MTRGFEVVSAFAGQDIHLPVRKTEKSMIWKVLPMWICCQVK